MEVHVQRGNGCGCFGCGTTLFSLLLSVGIGGLSFGLLAAMPNGGEEQVLAALASCPASVEVLGRPVERPILSPGCGEQESGAGAGRASWSFKVVGPKGAGQVSYTAKYEANQDWEVTSAVLETGGGSVVVVPCSSAVPERPERPEPPTRPEPARERPKRGGDERRPGRR